jgi:uncharacterized protein (DUF697 family)
MADASMAVPENLHAEASKIIYSAMTWSAAAGVVPVPALDLIALATVQGKMVADLSSLYGERATNEVARGLVSVLLGTLAPAGLTGAVASSGLKATPVIGPVLGAISMAGFSSAATYAIGKVFVRHFEGGGNLLDFSPKSVEEDLKAEFARSSKKA